MNHHLKSALSVRPMIVDDLDQVVAIEQRSFRNPWSRDLLAGELDCQWSRPLVAVTPSGKQGDIIVGYAIFWSVLDEAQLLDVAVHPSYRRLGIATLLLNQIVGNARDNKVKIITLEVRRGNVPAKELYRSFGFRSVGVRPRYYEKEGEDAIIMELGLC